MRRFLLLISTIFLLASCGGNGNGAGSPAKVSELLHTVPSRSIAVMHFNNCEKAMEMLLDSSNVFRQLDLGELSDKEMVLSYDYGAALIPLLAVNAGKIASDTVATISSIMEQLPALKLKGYFYTDTLAKRSALLISPSQAAITEAESHIGAETSILEAHNFGKALSLAHGSAGAVYLKNGSASRWLPKNLLGNIIPRKKLVNFTSGAGEWIVASFSSYKKEGIDIKTVAEDQRYFSKVIDGMKGEDSRLVEILPDTCEFVLDLPLADWQAYYEAYCLYLDSNSILSSHDNVCRLAKHNYGKTPEDWAKELNPKEIAKISWDGRQVLLLRIPKASLPQTIEENKYPGYSSLIFGGAFSLEDESSCTGFGTWLLVGNAEDIAEFALIEDRSNEIPIPSKDCRFAVYTPEALLYGKGSNIELNLY